MNIRAEPVDNKQEIKNILTIHRLKKSSVGHEGKIKSFLMLEIVIDFFLTTL